MSTENAKPAPAQEPRHVSRTLITLASFAKKKGVSRHAVYYHIKVSKNIIPTYVGMDKDIYLDWKVYGQFEFNENKTGIHHEKDRVSN
jgi:predicted DNA-binding protein YlxM (UPF0122 family)